ncbi:metalloregulator ArsR/SmtB family transcription factor [Nocardia sp. NPDC048505]|uniref:metalloregulator ArsR/SmtB family transcription factor n=1 Tax=unclassified Nocardia TaxID=2637762 RepID=UPI00341050EC
MDRIAAALGDSARWRIVELLTERPRSVGELAELTGLRQPQTTKHLQTLARAGLVTVFPLGQRRVYAVEAEPLRELRQTLDQLLEAIQATAGERDAVARYRAAIDAETARADRERWADGRAFDFDRALPAAPELVWRYWSDPALLESWWAPAPMMITACGIEPRPGGRVVLDYRDAEGQHYRSEGTVRAAARPERLEFDLSVLDDAGAISFTAHYALSLAAAQGGTHLRLSLSITETTVAAVPYIAGIDTGWGQVLDNLHAAIEKNAQR